MLTSIQKKFFTCACSCPCTDYRHRSKDQNAPRSRPGACQILNCLGPSLYFWIHCPASVLPPTLSFVNVYSKDNIPADGWCRNLSAVQRTRTTFSCRVAFELVFLNISEKPRQRSLLPFLKMGGGKGLSPVQYLALITSNRRLFDLYF